jgi:hypothetical protein
MRGTSGFGARSPGDGLLTWPRGPAALSVGPVRSWSRSRISDKSGRSPDLLEASGRPRRASASLDRSGFEAVGRAGGRIGFGVFAAVGAAVLLARSPSSLSRISEMLGRLAEELPDRDLGVTVLPAGLLVGGLDAAVTPDEDRLRARAFSRISETEGRATDRLADDGRDAAGVLARLAPAT